MATDLTTNEGKLADARLALHRLNTGQAVRVTVDQNGERVEFNTANADRLRAYIAELEGLIAGNVVTRRPLIPVF